MSEPAPTWTPAEAVAVSEIATVDALIDASFAAFAYRTCGCGRVLETADAVCHPCRYNGRLGPLYIGSFAGPRPIAPAPCRACATANARIDALLDQNDAQAIENSDLARQVVSLKGALEAQAAAVRQGKGGAA